MGVHDRDLELNLRESPEDDDECTVRGNWSLGKKASWPPPTANANKTRTVGKLKMPAIWDEGIPNNAIVYTRCKAPKSQDQRNVAKGIWKIPTAASTDDASDKWVPTDVQMYEAGDEPYDWNDKTPNGLWGLDPNINPKEEPKPSDLWFYPPGEKTVEGFEPLGRWRLPAKKTWPPRSVDQLETPNLDFEPNSPQKAPRKVGKLKVPGRFSRYSLQSD